MDLAQIFSFYIVICFTFAGEKIFSRYRSYTTLTWRHSSPELSYTVHGPSDDTLYSLTVGDGKLNTKDNRFSITCNESIVNISISNIKIKDAGIYRSKSSIGNINGCGLLIIKDKPSTPEITYDYQPFAGFPTVFSCLSKVRRWPIDQLQDASLFYQFFYGQDIAEKSNKITVDVTRDMKGTQIYCKAFDDLGEISFSENITMMPYYGPENISISPSNNSISIVEGEKLGPVTCSAECYPNCTYVWRKNSSKSIESNKLEIVNVTKEISGKYECIVKHTDTSHGLQNRTLALNVDVQYPPLIRVIQLRKQSTAYKNTSTIIFKENESVYAQLVIDSNPSPKLSLSSSKHFNQRLHYNRTESSFTTSFPKMSCEQSGNYTVSAVNGIKTGDHKIVNLDIQCKPKNIRINRTAIGARLGVSENITVIVTSSPPPLGKWCRDGREFTVVKHRADLKYILSSDINITTVSAFGQYCINISNAIGFYIVNVSVTAEDKPQPPDNLTYMDITSSSVNLSWSAGFDGGKQQKFNVLYKPTEDKRDDWSENNIMVKNVRKGDNVIHLLRGLMPETSYKVVVVAENSIGSRNASISFLTKAAPLPATTEQSNLLSIIIAVVVVVLVVLIFFLVVFVWRQRKSENNLKDNTVAYAVVQKEKNSNRRTSETQGSSVPENVEYAEVVKSKSSRKKKEPQGSSVPDNVEYAAVVKSKSSHRKKDTFSNQDTEQNIHINDSGRYTNEDGLTYIEVSFPKKKSNKKPVIHGAEDRTDYVDIDFTKWAEPLPRESD